MSYPFRVVYWSRMPRVCYLIKQVYRDREASVALGAEAGPHNMGGAFVTFRHLRNISVDEIGYIRRLYMSFICMATFRCPTDS